MPSKASICAQILGTFSCFVALKYRRLCSLPLSLFIGSVLQKEEESQESKRRIIEICLINDWPCRFPSSIWNHCLHYSHYSAGFVSIYLANHLHYPTNLPQLNIKQNTPEGKKCEKQAKLSMVTIVVIIRNDDHRSSFGHNFKIMSMVIIWWPWRSWLLVWPSFSEWRAWSLFSQSLYATRTALHKNRMMTMVVIFWMTTMAAIPEQSWKNRRRPWNDDHKERWPWMMTVAKKCQPDQFVDKNRKWKQKPTIRKFEQTFDHWFSPFCSAKEKATLHMSAWVLEKTLASILSPIYRFWNPVVMRIWEPQAGAHKNIFFSKNHHFGYHQTYPQNLHLFG